MPGISVRISRSHGISQNLIGMMIGLVLNRDVFQGRTSQMLATLSEILSGTLLGHRSLA